jgi:hypothetical protein
MFRSNEIKCRVLEWQKKLDVLWNSGATLWAQPALQDAAGGVVLSAGLGCLWQGLLAAGSRWQPEWGFACTGPGSAGGYWKPRADIMPIHSDRCARHWS